MSLNPVLPTPLTDFSFVLAPVYRKSSKNRLCAKLQGKFSDCLEAYGVTKAREKCAELLYDMIECDKNITQKLRSEAIQKRRMKLYREGKLDKPFEEHPPMDSYLFV